MKQLTLLDVDESGLLANGLVLCRNGSACFPVDVIQQYAGGAAHHPNSPFSFIGSVAFYLLSSTAAEKINTLIKPILCYTRNPVDNPLFYIEWIDWKRFRQSTDQRWMFPQANSNEYMTV